MPGPLRALLVSQPTDGGAARCVAQLAEVGVQRGLSVTVACPAAGPLASDARRVGATHVPLRLARQPGPRDVAAVAQLRRLCHDHDLVHLHSSKAAAVGRLAIRALGRSAPASVFTPHGWSWNSGGPTTPAYRWIERTLAATTAAIVAVSDEERAAGEAVLRGRGRIVVIPNGIDCATFSPDGARAPRHPDPLVVCVGRLAHPKGQAVAIRALAALADTTTRLRLVGDGPDRPALVELAQRLGVLERVELVGHSDDPASHVRAADIALVPSSSEGMSLAMLEAMACATPVVSTAVPGSSAIGDAGAVVPVDDHRAMAAAVADLLGRPDLGEIGARARRRAVANHRYQDTCARVLDLWDEVRRGTPGRVPA